MVGARRLHVRPGSSSARTGAPVGVPVHPLPGARRSGLSASRYASVGSAKTARGGLSRDGARRADGAAAGAALGGTWCARDPRRRPSSALRAVRSPAPFPAALTVASYHLAVKTVKRSAGRSATAAAAYRSGGVIVCEREGRVHDYSRKAGVEESFILAPEGAPDWAHDRAALWNAAEAAEVRSNAVVAREWELALPAEIGAEARRDIAETFARHLVARYGVAADVAIHAPHREGDERNHHAHVLTTTREIGAEGLGKKTRVLDAAQTGGPEVSVMREIWAVLQNEALERAGEAERVDHRSLERQREVAMTRGDPVRAEELDRAPEVKLGPVVSAIERRAAREAAAAGRDYAPVTERGRAVQEAREARRVFDVLREELRERVEAARDAYGAARGEGQDRVSAGLAAMRAALEKQRVAPEAGKGVGDRLRRMLAWEQERGGGEAPGTEKDVRARLDAALGRDRAGGVEKGRNAAATGRGERKGDREAPREVERPARPLRGRGRQRDDDWER